MGLESFVGSRGGVRVYLTYGLLVVGWDGRKKRDRFDNDDGDRNLLMILVCCFVE